MTIKGFAKIEKGKLILDSDFEKRISETNEFLKGEIIFVPYDKPHHWLHEYYRGYLLKDIADHIGEDKDMVHLYLKKRFLTIKIKDLNILPAIHRKTAMIIYREKNLFDYSSGEILETIKYYEVTYSTGSITGREFRIFIQQVENFFMEYLSGSPSKRTENEGIQYRDKGFEDEEQED